MKTIFSALLACLLWTSNLSAQTPFYEGKTVRIVVGFSPGGAYDVWARLIAPHWSKYIPGSPTFVVQNMTGGGSMIAANHVYNVAKPDGLTLGFVSPGIYIEQLAGRKEVQHDWLKFSHVGSPESTARIFYIRADTGYKTIEDIRKAAEPPKCGATGVGTASYYWPKLLADAFGFKLNVVPGYPGAADVNLAIEKGEMHCWGGTVQNISALSRAAPGPRQDSYACSLKAGKSAIQDYLMFQPSGSLWISIRQMKQPGGWLRCSSLLTIWVAHCLVPPEFPRTESKFCARDL